MSCLQVTIVRPSLSLPNQYNTFRSTAIQSIAPVNSSNLHNAIKPTIVLSKKCTNLMRCHVMQRTRASRYQQCTPVCLFGGKGESKNGDEGSPWKSLEKAMSSFKKEKSLEDVLRQQIEKKDYYDGGSGEIPPGGGGGGGGGGFGGTQDEGSFGEILDEILQVTVALLALIALYLYIIANDQVTLFITDTLKFLAGKKGPRLRSIMYDFGRLYQSLNTRVPYDPYWLEKAIITTPTFYDSPKKYENIIKSIRRASKDDMDTDSDNDNKASSDNMYTNDDDDDNDGSDNYNAKSGDSDNDNAYDDDDDDDDDVDVDNEI
ncbi:hypothetical protein LXL04_000041 [Taraxacum kok-saghyz]